jgi:hypothetical protein
METRPKAVVTLVHGTWARNAKWTKAGSSLFSHLEECLPKPAIVTGFSWSGKNSARARKRASEELCAHLRRMVEENPQAAHFVIGHSHGGNVALKAVAEGQMFETVSLICLSTPFFNIRPRFRGHGERLKKIGMGVLFSLMVVSGFLYPKFANNHSGLFIGTFFLVLFIFAGIGLLWRKAAREFADQVAISISESASLVVIRTVGDEASAFIGAFQIATWVMTKLGILYVSAIVGIADFVIGTKEKAERYLKSKERWMFAFIAILIAIDTVLRIIYGKFIMWEALLNLGRSPTAWRWSERVQFLGDHSPPYLVVLMLPLGLLALGIMLSGILPLGLQAVIGLLLYEVTVEAVPPGGWKVYQINPQEDGAGLMHSLSYESRLALQAVREWIDQRMVEIRLKKMQSRRARLQKLNRSMPRRPGKRTSARLTKKTLL